MLERCLTYLKRAENPTDTPQLIEKRYRRWLHAQVFDVFAPDYAKRADEVFKRYRTLSGAIAIGATVSSITLRVKIGGSYPAEGL